MNWDYGKVVLKLKSKKEPNYHMLKLFKDADVDLERWAHWDISTRTTSKSIPAASSTDAKPSPDMKPVGLSKVSALASSPAVAKQLEMLRKSLGSS